MKQWLTTLFLLCMICGARAQVVSTVEAIKGERWWGGYTALGSMMPFVEPTAHYDFRTMNFNNQAAPFFVSNMGRYIYAKEAGKWTFDGEKFIFDMPQSKVGAVKVGKTLRQAYLLGVDSSFKPSGVRPPDEFFTTAQWNTWIELLYDQSQTKIMDYAHGILRNGFRPGILMVDDNWQRYYGSYDFKSERFSDPRAMIDSLHSMGFKVMLWVCPFVSPDTPEFRDLERRGYLLKNADGSTRITHWWNGFSATYDLLNPEVVSYVEGLLRTMMQKYGVDGFKFDAGDVQYYEAKNAAAHSRAWQDLALRFPYNEMRASWGGGSAAHVQRLGDKDYSWQALQMLIPHMVSASLLGYPYTCPDMIGGGQYGSFIGVDRAHLDQKLIVRWGQASALMPMMQFSVAPWKVLDSAHLSLTRRAAALHEKFAPYILDMANQAAKTGEPIVRAMEYQFPGQGFSDCKDQFMLGSKFLVAPILTTNNLRTVRLPSGVWIDDLGKKFRGPVVISTDAPPDRLPYYELK
ncbi:MAG: glycoside hydrolase family 31 protein [Mucinivorans sp.]